mgnify:FL=1
MLVKVLTVIVGGIGGCRDAIVSAVGGVRSDGTIGAVEVRVDMAVVDRATGRLVGIEIIRCVL